MHCHVTYIDIVTATLMLDSDSEGWFVLVPSPVRYSCELSESQKFPRIPTPAILIWYLAMPFSDDCFHMGMYRQQ